MFDSFIIQPLSIMDCLILPNFPGLIKYTFFLQRCLHHKSGTHIKLELMYSIVVSLVFFTDCRVTTLYHVFFSISQWKNKKNQRFSCQGTIYGTSSPTEIYRQICCVLRVSYCWWGLQSTHMTWLNNQEASKGLLKKSNGIVVFIVEPERQTRFSS